MVLALMISGLLLAGLSLWQVGRLLRQAEAAPARLDALVDELVATAEATTATVADRAEALGALLEAADARIASLQALCGGLGGAATPGASVGRSATPAPGYGPAQAPGAPAVTLTPSLTEVVSARLAAGQDEATIARELGIARTAVRLAARAGKTGGER